MRNPYQVLGVSESASMDEIKKAYRKLSRIYHPDANVNNPNKDAAEAKFKEIQAAYKQIVDEKENGGRSYGNYGQSQGYGNGGYSQGQGGYRDPFEEFFGGGFGGYTERRQESNESTLMQAAGNYIRNGHYREALNVLSNIPEAERNAKWYYYSAVANSGVGNNVTAQEHAKKAVELEPDNYQYQSLLQRLQSGTSWYTERGQSYGRSYSNLGTCCCECMAISLCCNGYPCFAFCI